MTAHGRTAAPVAYPLRTAARMLGVDWRVVKQALEADGVTLRKLGRQNMVPAAWVHSYGSQGTAA